MTKLLLVDGNSLTYRAFFALPQDMSTASGQLTNAVFGFTSMFINVLKEQRPDEVLVAFDRPEPTFRHEADETYKANRDAAPDPLRQQMGLVREVLQVLGVATCELRRLGGRRHHRHGRRPSGRPRRRRLIVTGDRDAYQLVQDPHIRVLYNRRGVSDYALYDEAGIFERTGVTPAQYPEYAAMRGDPSDNLPGVPGVGEKTAAKLIQTYGGLDGIYENVDKQTPKLRASLAEHEERVRKNHEIMILRRDAPIELPESLVMKPDMAEVQKLFDFLEFRTFAERLAEALGPAAVVLSSAEREQLVAEVSVSSAPAESALTLSSLAAVALAAVVGGRGGADPAGRAGRRHRCRGGRGDVDPGQPPRRPRRRRCPRRRRGAGPRRQGADAHAARPPAADRPRRPGPRHRDRRLPPRPGRGPLPARATWSSATPASPWRRKSRPRRASSTSTARPPSRRPSPGARRSPCTSSSSRSCPS